MTKKVLQICLLFALFFTLAPTIASANTLNMGDQGKEIRSLQWKLHKLQFYPWPSNGIFDQKTLEAVKAFQKYQRISADGIVGKNTKKRLNTKRLPKSKFMGQKHVEVDLTRQLIFVYNGKKVTRIINTSTGMPGYLTPTGKYSIYRKELKSWSIPYSVWMPYASYFTGGIAFHEGLTSTRSHGCVRVPTNWASHLYQFASYNTPVYVYY